MKLLRLFLQPNNRPILRLMMIMLAVGVLDVVYVMFASKPLPGAAIIPAMIPLLTCIVVIPLAIRIKKSS